VKIVISYRRQHSQDITMRIRDAMVAHFGKQSVFTDIDNIPYGIDFRPYINWEISTCDAMIAVVGPHWIDAGQGPGQGVHLEKDFVRVEVEAALKRGLPVIPALVAGTRMPSPDELPDVLRDFAFCNAAPIDSGVNFHNDVDRLIRSLDETLAPKRTQEKRRILWANTLASIGIVGALLTQLIVYVPSTTELGQIIAILTPSYGFTPFAMPIFLAIAAWGLLGKFRGVASPRRQ
jgi:TIR domain